MCRYVLSADGSTCGCPAGCALRSNSLWKRHIDAKFENGKINAYVHHLLRGVIGLTFADMYSLLMARHVAARQGAGLRYLWKFH